jgi:hypothetical protein
LASEIPFTKFFDKEKNEKKESHPTGGGKWTDKVFGKKYYPFRVEIFFQNP